MWGWVVRDGPPLMEMEWVRVKDSPLPGDVALVSARVKVVLEGAGFLPRRPHRNWGWELPGTRTGFFLEPW